MGCGETFCKGIEAIYSDQQAKLIINGNVKDSCNIGKGTRQECPLSPLLFILVLEPLNKRIYCTNIRGIVVGEKSYKLKAFADDLIIMTENPKESLLKVSETIKEFGQVTGFKLNRSKTKLLVKNMVAQEREELERTSKLTTCKKVKYLGIWLMAKTINLFQDNDIKAWKEIKRNLEIWSRLK